MLFTLFFLALGAAPEPPRSQPLPRVLIRTDRGDIVVEVDTARAPVTAANFLRYVDGGFYEGGRFHRTVRLSNQPGQPVKIEVVQAGVNPSRESGGFPPIAIGDDVEFLEQLERIVARKPRLKFADIQKGIHCLQLVGG